MNKKTIPMFIVTVCLLCVDIVSPACAQSYVNSIPDDTDQHTVDLIPSDAYDYPIKPGTSEWNKLNSFNEIINACQIPEDILKNMSTRGLVETVVNYPFGALYSSSNNPQDGVNRAVSHFNGLSELFRRKDAAIELLAKYRTMDPAGNNKNWPISQQAEYTFKILNTELVIVQYNLLSQLNQSELRDLISVAISKYQGKQDNLELWGGVFSEPTLWILGRALQQANYPSFMQKIQDRKVQIFIDDGSPLDEGMQTEIISLAEQFLAAGK